MVDIVSRDRAFRALKRFADGLTTNDEFELEYADASPTEDRAIQAIDTMIWQFFSDTRVHRLIGEDAPSPEGRALLERCLRFLRTDREYAWPEANFIRTRGVDPLSDLLTFGYAARRAEKKHQDFLERMAAAGDFSVWPFTSAEELEVSSQNADHHP